MIWAVAMVDKDTAAAAAYFAVADTGPMDSTDKPPVNVSSWIP